METKHDLPQEQPLSVLPVIGSPKFIPILFSTPMIQAIISSRKTQTRRIIKQKYSNTDIELKIDKYGKRLVERQNDVPALKVVTSDDGKVSTVRHITMFSEIRHPYKKGDVLWVRETFYEPIFEALNGKFYYKADLEPLGWDFKWKPSIFMPKEACRLFLKVTDVRIERLQDISEGDAINEGITEYAYGYWKNYMSIFSGGRPKTGIDFKSSIDSFKSLWSSINSLESWKSNPWVWVVEFERIERPTGFL